MARIEGQVVCSGHAGRQTAEAPADRLVSPGRQVLAQFEPAKISLIVATDDAAQSTCSTA